MFFSGNYGKHKEYVYKKNPKQYMFFKKYKCIAPWGSTV